ncbi:cell agglutination protein Mam3 [Malassezia pachydermatis]|uniref:Membrane protein n=1 Tax=Malassezia pachydermatis TaxID=77020 RepID=A0A0N0RSA6_9BASI|nr:membrane protein [Malassezia pachydermatis]KOS14195.1 membrane protein [Malassezia pachydermatis]
MALGMSADQRVLRNSGAAPQGAAKLIMALLTYAFHSVFQTVRASPIAPWAVTLAHMSDDGTSGHGADPIVVNDPWKKTIDIIIIGFLVLLGGIFAGLTLGLMGLDMVNLQVLLTSGSEQERAHAAKVMRLLERGRHWVLVVLLLSNVIVNETLPIFLSEFGSGLTAVIVSTVLIVIFGEVVPQSICARYGLAIGAMCAPMVHIFMIILAPIAWPIAKLLDYCLGEDHGTTYRKAELKTFVSLHQQIGTEILKDDEVTIIRAVLDLNEKTLRDVMTPIDDVYTLPVDHVLDEDGVDELVQSGYSRVPIHEPKRPDAILGMLLVKQLIQYDPEDAWPVSRFHLNPLPEASPELNLLDAINYMQVGRSHMILVSEHPGEPSGALGVVTLEDIIEEMIGEEIIDETDVFVDVHNKIRVVRQKPAGIKQDQWQPLIRGIIERRRKHGGPNQVPLHNSYGTMGSRSHSQNNAQKYGLVPSQKARDKVSIKKVGSLRGYESQGEMSPRTFDKYIRTPSSMISLQGGSDTEFGPESLHLSESEQACHANGPYIVEMGGSRNERPRVLTVADLNEETAHNMRLRAAANTSSTQVQIEQEQIKPSQKN